MLAVKLILLGAVMTNVTAYFAGGGVRAPVCEMAAKGFGQSSSKPTGKTKPDRSRKVEGERGYHTTSFHNTDSYYTSWAGQEADNLSIGSYSAVFTSLGLEHGGSSHKAVGKPPTPEKFPSESIWLKYWQNMANWRRSRGQSHC